MTRHQTAAAPPKIRAADAMHLGRPLPSASRMAAGPLPDENRQGPVSRAEAVSYGLLLGVLLAAMGVASLVGAWLAVTR